MKNGRVHITSWVIFVYYLRVLFSGETKIFADICRFL